MSDYIRMQGSDPRAMDSARPGFAEPRAASGWIAFAGTMAILVGFFNIIVGLVALFKNNYYVSTPGGYLVMNLTGWGWLHLIVGALAAAAGAALFSGAGWAKIVVVVLAGFNALAMLAFISAAPAWGLIVIVMDVLVIWAVIAHSNEPEPSL
ncbi:hypothetical protein VSH64_44880 [Amycolatopsis rhabdoformis]|uniref:DUF7144 domain-containing protein n=1 Tax=Amycolatopsis rhabdoformis TaxID=1448059 RepID=A0ABZ1I7P1_9PSEU|nr:hypothetical protein [Amycolatopsis rhabdoformis]WSE29852.1 hypothetical protein VSH64_44880 [Amycolatopsis rhabdoformis]